MKKENIGVKFGREEKGEFMKSKRKMFKFRIWDQDENMSEVGLMAKSEKEALWIIEEEEGGLSHWERIRAFTNFPDSMPHA